MLKNSHMCPSPQQVNGTPSLLHALGAALGFMASAQITVQEFTAPPQWFGLIERIDIYGSIL